MNTHLVLVVELATSHRAGEQELEVVLQTEGHTVHQKRGCLGNHLLNFWPLGIDEGRGGWEEKGEGGGEGGMGRQREGRKREGEAEGGEGGEGERVGKGNWRGEEKESIITDMVQFKLPSLVQQRCSGFPEHRMRCKVTYQERNATSQCIRIKTETAPTWKCLDTSTTKATSYHLSSTCPPVREVCLR